MKRVLLTLTAALTLGAFTTSVMAEDTITQGITAGTGSASVADLNLGTLGYSHDAQNSTGTMVLTVDDSRGTGAGWTATIISSAFVNGANSIPAANFALTVADAPVMTDGQAIDVTAGNGPAIPTLSPVGTLEVTRTTLEAGLGFGQGTYTQDLDVSLAIPAQARAGTYTGTLTSSFSAAP